MEVRPYTPADREACLALFDSNTPDYLAPHQRATFEAWLDAAPTNYVVLEHEGTIVASGGYTLPSADTTDAQLVWGIVGRQWQRQGLGRYLLMYRMREIGRSGRTIQLVTLQTTSKAAPFFAAQGFQTVRVTKDGFAEGLDKVEMIRKISVCP